MRTMADLINSLISPTSHRSLTPALPSIKSVGAQQPWLVNQQLTANVLRLGNGEAALRINGNVYTPVGAHDFVPGTTRQLRVKSLDPVIKLTLISDDNGLDVTLQPARVDKFVAGNSLWASSIAASPYKLASLLSYLQNPPAAVARQLPEGAMSAIATFSGWMPNTVGLRSPHLLRTRIKDYLAQSITLPDTPSKSTPVAIASLLSAIKQSLLVQTRSFNAVDSYALGNFRADPASQHAVLGTLAHLIDEASSQTILHKHALLSLWSFGMPVGIGEQARVFSFIAQRRRHFKRHTEKGFVWRISCNCELLNSGVLSLTVGISGHQASIRIACQNAETSHKITAYQALLVALLEEHGVTLSRFSCKADAELHKKREAAERILAPNGMEQTADFTHNSQLNSELNSQLQLAAARGELPVLESFSQVGMRGNGNEMEEMPDAIYKILACLFGFLLDTCSEQS